jgi:signal transduction histidine kinase
MFDYFLVAIFFSYPAVLAERLRRSNKDLQDAQTQIESLVLEKERERLAGQIHDSVTQLLLGVNLLIDDALNKSAEPAVVERLRLAKEAAGKAIQQARLAVEDLFEERFSSRPLSETVREVLEQAGDLHELKVVLCAEGVEPELRGEAKKALYFIVQELAGNIIKHAAATEVAARMLFTKEKVVIQVSDNGKGFEKKDLEFGYGLSTISSRVRQLKGTFSLEPGEAGGATALIEVPTSALLA